MPEDAIVPDVYADLVQIASTDTGVILGFRVIPLPYPGASDDTDNPLVPVLRSIVRLNKPQAKIFSIMLRRALKSVEQEDGIIELPPGFLEHVDLTPDEW